MRRIYFSQCWRALGPGCTYPTATPAVHGQAYVIRNAYSASGFWNCDATSGELVCYQTKERHAAAGLQQVRADMK